MQQNKGLEILEKSRTENGDYQGMTVEIFRNHHGGSSNNGISANHTKVFMIMPRGHELASKATEKGTPIVAMIYRPELDYMHVAEHDANGKRLFEGLKSPMFGGTFVYTSDARFREISAYPLPLHDRYE